MKNIQKEICCPGCKLCNTDLKLKDLKGTIECLHVVIVFLISVIVIMAIIIFSYNDSLRFWKNETSEYRTKYVKVLTKAESVSNKAEREQCVVDLLKSENTILNLNVKLAKSDLYAQKLQYEYLILQSKNEK